MVLDIRAGSAADAAEIRRVRRESWIAAYAGMIDRAAIDRAFGFASFGPERAVVSASYPAVPQAGGSTALPGELYALYVTPARWSTGTGRALMGSALAALNEAGYPRVVLWVLADNARARRFYERAGFAPDGVTNMLTGLGGVLELRYARDL